MSNKSDFRITPEQKAAFDEIDKGWALIVSWLPGVDKVSTIDAAIMVAEQWEKTKAVYRDIGWE